MRCTLAGMPIPPSDYSCRRKCSTSLAVTPKPSEQFLEETVMSRPLLASSLAAATLGLVAAYPASADRNSRLDEDGKPVGSAWSETARFEALTAAGIDDVRFTTGERWRIRAQGDARAVAQLRFLVDDGSLVIGRTSGQRERFGKARIEVTAPSLRSVTSAGSGSVDVERLSGPRVSATVAGSGRADVRSITAERLSATVAGAGALGLIGRSDRADVTVAGSGRLAGDSFTARSANVTMAGSGDARFRSPGEVRATIAGSGTITVSGTTDCRQTRMGSGRLICRR
jgi:hypothetical protein